jgi:hypothetical protein
MTLYSKALRIYSRAYLLIENACIKAAVSLNLDELITGVNKAKEAAMLQNMEMLMSNISACKTYQHLRACENMYQMLCLSYPEFHDNFGAIVTKSINNRKSLIK